jgi:hypothetical protein
MASFVFVLQHLVGSQRLEQLWYHSKYGTFMMLCHFKVSSFSTAHSLVTSLPAAPCAQPSTAWHQLTAHSCWTAAAC